MEPFKIYNHIEENFKTLALEHALDRIKFRAKEQDKHLDQVESYSIAIGAIMNLSGKDLKDLGEAAKLHDLGKAFIDPGVLYKAEKLTLKEMEEIKKHPEIGYWLLKTNIRYEKLAKVVRHHHERWDGLGYPEGLIGGEIPLFSRIIAVADAYDAMTSDRVYQKTKSREEAIWEIIRNSGSQFDPRIAEIFIEKVLLKCKTFPLNTK